MHVACVTVMIITVTIDQQWGMPDPRSDNERLQEVAFSSDRKRMEVTTLTFIIDCN
jgi:magnesium-transporting ATPase (P-type)